jgi:hypothetical protein
MDVSTPVALASAVAQQAGGQAQTGLSSPSPIDQILAIISVIAAVTGVVAAVAAVYSAWISKESVRVSRRSVQIAQEALEFEKQERLREREAVLEIPSNQTHPGIWVSTISSLGDTVVMRGILKNAGQAPARNIAIQVFMGDVHLKTNQGITPILVLEPEQQKEFEFILDLAQGFNFDSQNVRATFPTDHAVRIEVTYSDGTGKDKKNINCFIVTGDRPAINWRLIPVECS